MHWRNVASKITSPDLTFVKTLNKFIASLRQFEIVVTSIKIPNFCTPLLSVEAVV